MPELNDPQDEKACQLRACGQTQVSAYAGAFGVPTDSKANNSSRFFRREAVRLRVREIKERRALLADLNEGFVLRQLRSFAEGRLDDFTLRDKKGAPIGLDDLEWVRVAKLKLAPQKLAATELLGKHIGMWPSKVAMEHTGKDGGPMQFKRAADLTDDELAAVVAAGGPAPASSSEG